MTLRVLKELFSKFCPVIICVWVQDPFDPLHMIEGKRIYGGEFGNIPEHILDMDISVIYHTTDSLQIDVK